MLFRYNEVVKVCQLIEDFVNFPHGDNTWIGENGINLSGGQKARLNLARAVYSNADIFLLDDPLSAVDAHVGREINDKCINGYLSGKTVILVTHQFQYIQSVDKLVVLQKGKIVASGAVEEINASNLDFIESVDAINEMWNVYHSADKNDALIKHNETRQEISESEREVKEEQRTGSIPMTVYLSYLKNSGSNFGEQIFTLLLALICPFTMSFGDYFLAEWLNAEEMSTANVNGTIVREWKSSVDRNMYIYIYAGILLANTIFLKLSIITMVKSTLTASKHLHEGMLNSILKTHLSFFTTNPLGRIVNR